MANLSSLKGFFHPKGIVVAGVSTKPEKFSMAKNIVTLFAELGREDVYCVNPKGGETIVQGRSYPLYKSIAEVPYPYDLVVYAAPGQYSLEFIKNIPAGKSVILISGIPADMKYEDFVQGMGERQTSASSAPTAWAFSVRQETWRKASTPCS